MNQGFYYGGQALIEGVMIRGRKNVAMAVRRPDGKLSVVTQPLARFYTGPLRQWPLVRGVIALIETLVLGLRALLYSARVSVLEEEEEIPSGLVWVTGIFALALAMSLFFILPLFLARFLDPYIASSLVSNLVEGFFRLGIFVAYIKGIGLMPDIRRVFAYHGAEHKVVNAYEAGSPLEVGAIRNYGTAHVRCGTSFALTVFVVAIFVFALVGRPSLPISLLSRIVLLPAIAALSYEITRFGAGHFKNGLVRAIMAPGLALQTLTTRPPDEGQLEAALGAMRGALEADEA